MPRIEHRNSPSPIPFHKLFRPRSKHGAKGSIGMAMRAAKASLDDDKSDTALFKASDAVFVLDCMASDGDKAEGELPHSDDDTDTAPLKSPRTPKGLATASTVVGDHKQDDGGSTTIGNDGAKKSVMEDVQRLLETLSPFADFDEAWGQSKPD